MQIQDSVIVISQTLEALIATQVKGMRNFVEFSGVECDFRSDCNNRGNCRSGVCQCDYGYGGVKCNTSKTFLLFLFIYFLATGIVLTPTFVATDYQAYVNVLGGRSLTFSLFSHEISANLLEDGES